MTAPRPAPMNDPEPQRLYAPDFDMNDHIIGVTAFLGGTANVIMQLGLRPVAYGVMESDVKSGNVMEHPFKRLRTTLTYLAVAMLGTDEERNAYRLAVNTSHRHIRTKPTSPVKYNAFDPKLQLWVAACLYFGFVDLLEKVQGPMDEATADTFYAHSIRLGTTLQVRPEMWPADRAAFWRFWEENLDALEIDDTTRAYFNDLIDLKMVARPIQWVSARFHRFVVTGCLPPQIREKMHLTWTEGNQRWFDRTMKLIGVGLKIQPRVLRQFPMNYYLWDMRRRIRKGKPLV
ncbi:oxygenase MpaB family protein [Nocardia fusca]|uniref:oxygenase MpaB family protein n=1 Tax=Nocardia fusca TaxID=941183 RepID=UPI000A07A25E|nr:oxygenase MpaB family protein [Nocardia fusca]